MIEPFEYEPRKLAASKPQGVSTPAPLVGGHSIDHDVTRTMSHLYDPTSDVKMEQAQAKIFQTRIGNPSMENPYQASLVPDRVTGKGPLVVNGQEPAAAPVITKSTSELLSEVLDGRATHVFPNTKHVMPPIRVNSLNMPFMTPGLTSVGAHKYTPNWA